MISHKTAVSPKIDVPRLKAGELKRHMISIETAVSPKNEVQRLKAGEFK